MKILIASDIHGNDVAFKKVIDFFKAEEIDEMILLGDIFSSYDYDNCSSHEISKLLWTIPSKIHVVLGNCDNIESQTLLPVGYLEKYEGVIGEKRFLCYHGHRSPFSASNVKLYISGHTHIHNIIDNNGIIYFNPGSVGRPRDFTIGSFGVLSEKSITIFDLNYNVIDEIIF